MAWAETDLEEIWLHTVRTWFLDWADSTQGDLIAAFEELVVGTPHWPPVNVRAGYLRLAVGKHVVF